MAKNFLDQPFTKALYTPSVVYGLDPSTRTIGVARVEADICLGGTNVDASRIKRIDLMAIPVLGTGRGWESIPSVQNALQQMVLRLHVGPSAGKMGNHAGIETQEIYPNVKHTVQSIVSKANDLLPLAAVSGLACAVFRGRGLTPHLVAPRAWMGQRSKEATCRDVVNRLDPSIGIWSSTSTHDVPAKQTSMDDILNAAGKRLEHSVDALGIAIHIIDRLSTGAIS